MKGKTHVYFFSTVLALLLICVLGINSFGSLKVAGAASSYCALTYLLRTNVWPGNFEVHVVIQNTSSSAWQSWKLVFNFQNRDQVVDAGWDITYTQSGTTATMSSVSYNSYVPVNGFVNKSSKGYFGFQFKRTNSSPVPTRFAVNGHVCSSYFGMWDGTGLPFFYSAHPPALPPSLMLGSVATFYPKTTSSPIVVSYHPNTMPSPVASYNPKIMAGTHIGNATVFSGIGGAYGGCGVPQADLDSKYYVALNVQNDPGNYSTKLSRPIAAKYAKEIGIFNNGLNCGRWVKVTIGDNCLGTNDGAPNKPFCHGGSWEADRYNGATLDMVVADSCQDGTAWCRDDPYHLDLIQSSLDQFVLQGQPVGNMYPNAWGNRHVSWQFVSAPNYKGDIKIAFLHGANLTWSAVSISHLANGIHGVRYYQNGTWVRASMDSDLGNDYVIGPTMTGYNRYQIQVYDSSDKLINNGRTYSFSYPTSCGSSCLADYLPISYTAK